MNTVEPLLPPGIIIVFPDLYMRKQLLIKPLATALLALFVLFPALANAGDLNPALRYVPPESVAVLGVDLDGLKKSPFFRRILKHVTEDPGIKRDLERTKRKLGFDLINDLNGFLIVATKEFVDDNKQFALIAETKLDQAQIITGLERRGERMRPQKGAHGPYFSFARGKANLAFRGPYLIAGGAKAVQASMKSAGSPKSPPSKFQKRLSKLAQGKQIFAHGKLPPQLQQQLARKHQGLGALQQLSLGLTVQGGLKAQLVAKLDSPSAANKLTTLLRKELDALRQNRQLRAMGLASYLNAIRIKQRPSAIALGLALSDEQLQRLGDQLEAILFGSSTRRQAPKTGGGIGSR